MNISEEKDVGIGLRDIFFYIMRKWRFFLCMGIGCAVLFGAFRVCRLILMVRGDSYRDQVLTAYEQAVDNRESELKRLDTEIADLKADLEIKQQYADQSHLMHMDPDNSFIASIDLCILGADDNATFLHRVYQSSFNSRRITGRMSEILKTDEEYLYEQLRIQDLGGYDGYIEGIEAISVMTNKTMLHVGLIAEDQASAEKLINALSVTLNELSQNLNQTLSTHQLILLDNGCVRYTEQGLENYQSKIQNEISALSDSIAQKQNEKNALTVPKQEEPWPPKTIALSCFKYILLGGFIGGCFSLVVLFFRCLFSEEILSPDELRKRAALKILAISAPGKKSLGAILDRFIVSRELKGGILSAEQLRKRLELETHDKQCVIWGSLPEDMMKAVIPQNEAKNTVDMEHMDSWQGMMLPEQEQKEACARSYILVADRRKDTYRAIVEKLDVINQLCGTNIVCILFV